ncbi:MAG: undecaprenyl-diphosphate phosphatase, partial [Martelella sp.]
MTIGWIEAAFLGLLQGLTEFLPISSSAHLRIAGAFLPSGADPGAAFTAITQIGTELAVLVYFWSDIMRIAKAWLGHNLRLGSGYEKTDIRMGWLIIIGSLPIVVLGIALKDVIEQDFRSLWIIGSTLIVLGLVLGIADKFGRNDRAIKKMGLRDALLMGLAQAAALVPGVSRSGATISMGRFLGFERAAATR